MANQGQQNPIYRKGYAEGFNLGYAKGKSDTLKKGTAYWIMTKNGWVCSNCGTKHRQAHDDFCCKCGSYMNPEEAK